MSKADLAQFQEKYHLSDIFISTVESLLNKLVDFGYIGIFKKKKLIEKLYENIEEVYIGTNNSLEYKTGFYDAYKKILYIRNEKDTASVYLRLLYALTTDRIDDHSMISGYMMTKLRTDSYKIDHVNFGINRAVISNLVCKLCNMTPANIDILSTYKSYSHNFLGYVIQTDNNIYALEGKFLSELCFALNIDEQLLYTGLFSKNPYKYLENILKRRDLKLDSEFFNLFDDTSRKYNWYNKLTRLSKKLNNNYLEFKKHALDNNTESLLLEKNAILQQVKNAIEGFSTTDRFNMEEEKSEEITETSLNENISKLEEMLTKDIVSMQNILCDMIISNNKYLTDYQYASRLKQFSTMMIMANEKIDKKIMELILYKLLPQDEITSVNLTVKIKYSLIQNILSESKYTSVSKSFSFNVIPELIDETTGVALVLLNINNKFARLVQVTGLNLPIENINTEPSFIPLDNFQYLLNSDYSNMYVGFLEKIYTALRFKYEEFKNLRLNDIYIFEYENKKYLIVNYNDNVYVLTLDLFQNNYDFKILDVSESYSLFEKSNVKIKTKQSMLPVVYKE